MNISRSPQRHTFQKEKYIQRQTEKSEPISQEYLDMFDESIEKHKTKFNDPQDRINNLEYDLLTTDWILEKARNSEGYAQNLYAAMCNTEFVKNDVWPRLQDKRWSCSWRYAGGIIADMRRQGDYIDWYCTGIRGDGESTNPEYAKFVGEGYVTDEVREDFLKLGWIVIDDDSQPI